jgi:hypothetical protein
MIGSTDGQRVEFLPKVFHGKRFHFTGREVVEEDTSEFRHTWESTASEEVQADMSIFPTKVLLATDGSKEADLAGRSAAELADETGSELHVVHVLAPGYPRPFQFRARSSPAARGEGKSEG